MDAAARISILTMGGIDSGAVDAVADGLRRAFSAEICVSPSAPVPPTAWMASRRQYDSTHLILYVETLAPPDSGRVLAMCDVDLASEVMTFVFGEAEIEGRIAVMSLHRLRQEVYGLPADPGLFRARAAKVAVHEMGHTWGLRHCFRYRCVMYPAETVEIADIKTESFCDSCTGKLKAAMGR